MQRFKPRLVRNYRIVFESPAQKQARYRWENIPVGN
jgi:hypothetical protein